MSSSDDECKLPPHCGEANTYRKHKTYNKNRKNGTYTGEIYDVASLLNIILCNSREFNSVCKTIGIRENFISTKVKKKYQFPGVAQMAIEHIFEKEQPKNI